MKELGRALAFAILAAAANVVAIWATTKVHETTKIEQKPVLAS